MSANKSKNTKMIQCLLEREGGEEVELYGKTLKFVPNEQGHHVCEVSSLKAYKRLMSIPEAYCEYDPDNVPTSKKNASEALAKKKYADDAPRREIAADQESTEIEDAFESDDIPDDDEADSGEDNDQDDDQGKTKNPALDAKTPEQLAKEAADKKDGDEKTVVDPFEGVSNQQLKDQIEFATKTKIHPKTGRPKLIAALQAIIDAENEKKEANKV